MVVRVISNAFLYILQREAQSCSVLDYVLVYLNVIVVIIDICLFPLPLASSIL